MNQQILLSESMNCNQKGMKENRERGESSQNIENSASYNKEDMGGPQLGDLEALQIMNIYFFT